MFLSNMPKPDAEDILIQISICNRGPEDATLHVLPTLWFRNTWAWWPEQPNRAGRMPGNERRSRSMHRTTRLGECFLYCEGNRRLLFTENETNDERIFGTPNATPYVKDAFHDYVVHGRQRRRQPDPDRHQSRRALPDDVGAGETKMIRLRLTDAARR